MPAAKKKDAAAAPPRKKKAAAAPKTVRKKKAAPAKLEPVGLAPDALGLSIDDPAIAALTKHVLEAGGAALGAYRDPLGGHPLLLASLPIDKVQPTSFQRDVSPAHVKKLSVAIGKTRRFLDPVIAIREDDGRFLTPNGNHRLTVMRELGARSIVALVVPERSVAYQILALNIEKAHNLRERAMEVRRMMVDLAGWAKGTEQDFELELDEPSLVTIGFAYEARPRISGGAYVPVVKKVDAWVPGTLEEAVTERRRRAALVLELDDAVEGAVARLKEKGLTSPYLRAFVVARINPLRFIKGEPPSLDELMKAMTKRASGLDAGKISTADLARSGGAPDDE